MIDIRSLKLSVQRDFPADSIIRQMILSEPDEIPIGEYVIKVPMWFKLMRVKT